MDLRAGGSGRTRTNERGELSDTLLDPTDDIVFANAPSGPLGVPTERHGRADPALSRAEGIESDGK